MKMAHRESIGACWLLSAASSVLSLRQLQCICMHLLPFVSRAPCMATPAPLRPSPTPGLPPPVPLWFARTPSASPSASSTFCLWCPCLPAPVPLLPLHAPTLPVQAPFHLRMPLASSAAFEDARLPARPPAGVQGPRRARHTYLGRVIVTGIAPTSNAQLWQRLTVAQATQPCASSTFGRPAPGQHLFYLRP